MISDAAVCNEQCGNELRIPAALAYTPAYTEMLNGGVDDLQRVIGCWHSLPEHVRRSVLLLINSAASSELTEAGRE